MSGEVLNYITYGLTAFVFLAFVWALIYFFSQKNSDHLIEKRRWIESLPTIISSLGVLGTFAGITLGLINFDPQNLDASIPLLLSGLKTAFFTSLTGMIGSIILSKLVSSGFDQKDQGVSDINQAAGLITQSISKMEKSSDQKLDEMSKRLEKFTDSQDNFMSSLSKFMEAQNKISQSMADCMSAINKDSDEINNLLGEKLEGISKKSESMADSMSAISKDSEEIKNLLDSNLESITKNSDAALSKLSEVRDSISSSTDKISASVEGAETAIIGQMVAEAALLEGQTSKMDEINNTVDSRLESLTISVGNVEEGVNSQVDNIKSINENVAEIVEASTGTYSTQSEIIDEIKKLSPVIRDEVTEIEEKMKETNELLTEKFDEFSELLRKSNTEALVEVMKGVTLEFEKQMSALINKLIQENFEQLNQSVANMNQWQQENKEMIVALTSQYKQMSTDFEETSTTLQKVGDETKSLISDGGRLHQIIEGLEQVMAKDKDFVATANSLKKAAEINEKNMAEYQEYTRNLNVWVQKQRDFVEGVKQLIKKLEELDKLRDFNNDFWAETKKNLEEAQGLMQNGAFFLRKELEGLDQHFYDRLSETLAQLDACIQAMITKNKK